MRKRETGSVARSVEKSSTYDPSTTPTRVAATEPEESMLKTAEPIEFADDEHAATNLELFADNTSELYGRKKDILRLLAVQDLLGTYDTAKAQKLWRGWIDVAALMYEKELGEKGDARRVFTPAIRDAVAASVEKSEKAELDLGNHDYLLDKKASTKQAADGNEALEQKEAELRFKRKDIGTLMLNWHGGSGDPIYAVGSYWIDGKQHPQPEVLERAKNGIGKLIGQASTEAGRKANGWTDADLDELYTIRDGMDEIEAEENALKAKEATTKDAVAKQAALSRQEAYALMASPLQDKALLIVGTNAAGNEDWDYVGYDLKAGDVPVDFLVAYMHRMGGMPGLKKEDLTPHSFVESQTKTLTKVVVSYALGDNRSIDMELRLKKTKAATAKSADLTKALGPLNDAVLKMNKAIEDAIQASMKAEPAEARKMLQTLIAMLDLEIKDYQGVIAETKKQLGTITVPVEASTKQAALSGKDRKRIIEIARSENDPNDLNFKDNADIEEVDEDGFWVEGTKYVWVDRPKDMVEASTKQAASVGSGANGYKGFFQGKEVDVHADTKLQALQLAREYFKAPKSKQHMVHVELAELGGQQVSIKPSTVGSVKTKQAGGLGLSESAIATHLDVMQDMLAKGDTQGLKKRLDQLAADIKRIAQTRQAVRSATDTVSTDGYHYVLEAGGDIDDPEAWETEMGEATGQYRGDVMIDGSRCILFHNDETGDDYAVLPQNATINGKEASIVVAGPDLRSLALNLYKSVVGRAGKEVAQMIQDAIKKAYELGAAEKAARVASLLKTAAPDADDLVLYIDNTESLYKRKQEIVKATMRHLRSGKYDAAKSAKLWLYLVDAGAQAWAKELGDEEGNRSVKWNDLFPKAVREQAARDMSETAKVEIEDGTWDFLNEKGAKSASVKEAAGAGLPDPSELGAGRLVDLVRSIQVVALGASKSQDPIGTIRKLLSSAGLGAVVEASTKRASTLEPEDIPADFPTPRVAAKWKALDDKLGKRWILDAKDSDVFDAFHIKEIKGPGIPLYSTQAIMKDGTTLRYRALKDLKEAQKVAESYLKSDKENASLLLTDGWTRT